MIIVDRQKELSEWIGKSTGGTYSTETGIFIGYEINNKISVVVACTDYNGCSCQFHIGIETIAPINFLKFCFQYGFEQLKVNKILTVVESSNVKSLRYSQKVGFKIECKIENAGKNNGDLYILSITKPDCRIMQQDWKPGFVTRTLRT